MTNKSTSTIFASLLLSVLFTSPINAATPSTSSVAANQQQDYAMAALGAQFLKSLWRADPEAAIAAGKYDNAAQLTIPDQASRARQLAFTDTWLRRFAQIDPARLSANRRTDLALINNHLTSTRWYLTSFREFEWNPAEYNISAPFDFILTTDYAPKKRRLQTLYQRLEHVPAYYDAARANIVNPTREHTKLALQQSPGALSVLDDIEKAAQASTLTATEKQQYKQRIAKARAAIDGYIVWLGALDKTLEQQGARSFRIGGALYEAKFAADIQSGYTAEQTYQRALAAKEQLLLKMNVLADQLWPKYMADLPKPDDRSQKIGVVIDKLSTNHIKQEDLFAEVRRQIPQLEAWVVSHDLLALDSSKPLIVRETPAYRRGVAGAGIEAPGPYRPHDRTYYNVTPIDTETPEQAESFLREYNDWVLQILNIHEAIPGHYAQLVHANKSPSVIKTLFGNGAMIEGWAVYGERMMLESGYGGDTPEMWLMYSKWNLRSVCNTILDYSTHVLDMSEADAKRLLMKEAFQTENEANGKWRRVQLTSVQLTSYFSGYSELYEFREQRKQALGTKFNLKDFHEEFLRYGSAPVRMIKALMLKNET